MNEPDAGYLFAYRCEIDSTYLEIAAYKTPQRKPNCPRCDLAMDSHGYSDVLISPVGGRWRSGNCRGCNARIKLVPLERWDDYCRECLAHRGAHELTGAPAIEWLPPDPHRFVVADQLLSSVFDSL